MVGYRPTLFLSTLFLSFVSLDSASLCFAFILCCCPSFLHAAQEVAAFAASQFSYLMKTECLFLCCCVLVKVLTIGSTNKTSLICSICQFLHSKNILTMVFFKVLKSCTSLALTIWWKGGFSGVCTPIPKNRSDYPDWYLGPALDWIPVQGLIGQELVSCCSVAGVGEEL